MSYRDFVTAADLIAGLKAFPADAIIDIAKDPELNGAGPIAMAADGRLSYAEGHVRENGRHAIILWPMSIEPLEDRYDDM